jgi:hypothetical protein
MYLGSQPKNGLVGIKSSDRISRIYNKVSLYRCSYMNHTCRTTYVQIQETLGNFMFFVPCIVIQLCNINQQIHTFQIKVLIQFLMSSTCLERHQEDHLYMQSVWYFLHAFM